MPGHIEYQHSEAIPPEEVQEHGPFTIFPVRRHKNYEIVNQSEQQARKDWEYHIGDGIARDFKGVENPVTGPWDSLVMPEYKADRMSRKGAHEHLNMPLYRVLQTAPLREVEATMPMEKLFFPRLRQLLDYDYERACLLFEGWRDWLEYADIRDENILKSVEAYLKYRETNVGFLPYSHLTIVVMMLDISPQERQSIDEFRNVAARSYSLTNDYWSWAREVRQSREGKQRMMNALSVVMRKQQVSEEESLEIVKSEAIENEQKVVKLWDSLSAQAGSQDFKQYLDAHIWLCSGNSYWSFTCARYHS